MNWGYIGLSCLGFWVQGLFWGWESCFYLALLGILFFYLARIKASIYVPKVEGSILGLFLLGYGLSLIIYPTNASLISLIKLILVCAFVISGVQVVKSFDDVMKWYRVYLWNVCALLLLGWLIRSDGLLESVFDYANLVAALCMMAIIFTFPQLFSEDQKKRWVSIALFIFFLASLLATGARIAWGITLVSVIWQTWILSGQESTRVVRRICYGILAALSLLIVSVRFFLEELWQELTQTSSLRIRLTYDWDALRIALDHPLLGVGAEGWDKLQYQYQTALYSVRHIHNHVLQLWLEGGILALLAWGVFIWVMIRDYSIIRKCSNKQVPTDMQSIWLSTIAVVVYSTLDFILSFPALFCAVLFYLVVRRVVLQTGGEGDLVISRGVVMFIGTFMIVSGVIAGYREGLVVKGEAALAEGNVRTVLKYEQLPEWCIPSKDRALLLGRAFLEKAKRTQKPEDWQKSLYYLGGGIKEDHEDLRFYPPYVYSSLQLMTDRRAVEMAEQLILLQPRLVDNYELYAEALHLAGDNERVLQIPKQLEEEKHKVYQEAIFKKHIPTLHPTDRLQQLIQESASP
ncbi:O-antigen ligase family protein [Brevibacillus ginsengisoli]|uniref:O-antigen ligase family protein n=1 Tax=Brevibacillus ginsengisoli TaxID=363854 RepID=UPI003CF41343